jgi:hypothetical protein
MQILTIFSFARRAIGAQLQLAARDICFSKRGCDACNKPCAAALVAAYRNSNGHPVFTSTLPAAAAWLVLFSLVAEAREPHTPAWDKIAGGREGGKPVVAVIGLRQQQITVPGLD